VEVVRRYPGVTLLDAPDNGGPYRLVQAVIDATAFDAYLFQDADDWSAPDRLEVLLTTAEEAGAELVGSHEVRVLVDQADMQPWRYPLDVNAALADRPASYPLLHPTSLVSRDLVTRLGGFATGMRFSGDAEFLRRAGHVARVVNADHIGYFRRKRGGSLTTSTETGFGSPARQRWRAPARTTRPAPAAAVASGGSPDLSPWQEAASPSLRLSAGPDPARPAQRPAARPVRRPPATDAAAHRPVLVVAPPRCGDRLLAWALGQHPDLRALPDPGWLARAGLESSRLLSAQDTPPPADQRSRLVGALTQTAAGGHPQRWVASFATAPESAWALSTLLPEAVVVVLSAPVEVAVAALQQAPTEGSAFFTPELALRQWVTATRTGLDLQAALGPGRVVHVHVADLLADPGQALSACLRLAGLAEDRACLRPFASMEPLAVAGRERAPVPPGLAEVVQDLSDRLARDDAGDPTEARDRLDASLLQGSRAPTTLVDKVRALARRAVPEASTVVVVSRGDDDLLALGPRTGWHLPQLADGTYAGHHPADSDEVVGQLAQLTGRGAEYLLVPAASLWWLSFYAGLRGHLEGSARLVAYEEDAGAVYRLATPPADDAPYALRWGPYDDGRDS
jgi:hypothetical protein